MEVRLLLLYSAEVASQKYVDLTTKGNNTDSGALRFASSLETPSAQQVL